MQERAENTKSFAIIMAIATFIVYFCCDAGKYSLHYGAPTYNTLMFSFMHANIAHLLCNLWSFLAIVFYKKPSVFILISTFLATIILGLLPIMYDTGSPIIGMSAWIYCVLGRYGITFNIKRDIRYNAIMFLTIAVGLLLPNISWMAHVTCYMAGMVIALFTEPINIKRK